MNAKELEARIGGLLKEARDIAAKAEAENRDFTEDERARVTVLVGDAKAAKADLDRFGKDQGLRDAIKSLGDGVALGGASEPVEAGEYGVLAKGQTVGSAFVGSTQFKGLMSQFPGGRVQEKARVQSVPFGLKALVTGASDTSAGALVQNDNIGLQVGLGAFQRPLTLLDVVSTGTTSSDTIEYVQVTSTTNNAAVVAEATSAAAPTAPGGAGALVNAVGGGYKPESGMALAKVTTNVKTIAHWIPATKRSLSDASQIRTLIDQFLVYGLREKLEDQVATGDGNGENFTGILNVSGTQSQAWDTNLLTTTRKARTKVRTVGRVTPNAFVLNPADWEAIDLLQTNEGNYYFGGPARLGTPTLWGLPVVESEAIPAGTGLVGDFGKCVLWNREQASVSVTDSHADFFVRNLVAILAEMRAAFGIVQPNAIIEIDLTA